MWEQADREWAELFQLLTLTTCEAAIASRLDSFICFDSERAEKGRIPGTPGSSGLFPGTFQEAAASGGYSVPGKSCSSVDVL